MSPMQGVARRNFEHNKICVRMTVREKLMNTNSGQEKKQMHLLKARREESLDWGQEREYVGHGSARSQEQP